MKITKIKSITVFCFVFVFQAGGQGCQTISAFQIGYITLQRELQNENKLWTPNKKRVVPNRSAKNCPLQRALRNEGFRRVQLMDTSALMILCADSLHDDGATIWAWDDNAEGHFKKRLFDPLHQGHPVPVQTQLNQLIRI